MRKIILLVALCFALIGSVYAQQTVTGIVTDEEGLGIPGVSVMEKGTVNGTITDADGNYTITVKADALIVFSFVGMKTIEESLNGRSVINVTLVTDAIGVDEVVVTALGIRREAKALGYAVSKVDNERILATGTPVNALQSLYGSAAGVQVASTATGPTGGMKINIRNAVSFDSNSTTRPLIVVDGIPIHDQNTQLGADNANGRDYGTGINDINPDDIASFEILKGAKASVLYGSAGANGVVLITTKSGAKGKDLGVSASFTTTWDNVAFLPEIQNQYGTGRSPSTTVTDDQGFYLVDGVRTIDNRGQAFGPKFDPSVTLDWWDGTQRPWVAQSESVYDKMYRTGHQYITNVAISSGGEKGSMRFSYTNTDLSPTTLAGSYDKNTFSLNASYKMNDYINISYSGNLFFSKNMNAVTSTTMGAQGITSSLGAYSYDIDVDLLNEWMVTPDGYNYFANPAFTESFSSGRRAVVNYLWDQTQNEDEFTRLHNIQSLNIDITLNKIFSATIMGGADVTTERSQYRGKLTDPSLIGPASGNVYQDVVRDIRKTYGQALLNFNSDIVDERFNLSGFVGGVVSHSYLDRKGARQIGGFVIPNFFSYANMPSGAQPTYQFQNGEDIMYSVMGSVQFAYADQIFIEVQGRNDWSSILPPANNSYFYPGVSATWIASESLRLPEWIDFGKLRVSWADVGRPGPRYFGNVNYGVTASGAGFVLTPPNDLPPMDENGIPNLKPEKKREFEVGLETYLFDSRLGIDFSYYNSNTYDQIMQVAAPAGMGVSSVRMNAGNVSNKGWELMLKTKPVKARDFSWDVNLTFSGSKTKIVKLDGELTRMTLWNNAGLNAIAEVGGEYGLIYQQKGWNYYINPSDENDPNNGKRIVDASGNNYAYDTKSNKMVGKVLPDLIGGVFSSFNYKSLRFIANIDYSFGSTFISHTETYMLAAGVLKESLPYRDQASGGVQYYMAQDGSGNLYKAPGGNPNGGASYWDGVLLDGVYTNGTANNKVVAAEDYYYQSYFANGFFPEDRIFKNDYVALRNIAIEYTVPKKLSSLVRLSELSLMGFVNNVAYLYKAAPNTIPESTVGTSWSSASVASTALPAQRSMGLAVKVKF